MGYPKKSYALGEIAFTGTTSNSMNEHEKEVIDHYLLKRDCGLWWWQIREKGEPIYHDDIVNYRGFKNLLDKVRERKTKLEESYAKSKAGTRKR